MGNGRWSVGSCARVHAVGAVLILLLAGGLLLAPGSRRYAHQALDRGPASPFPTFFPSISKAALQTKLDAQTVLGQLPLIFEANQGQAVPEVKFLARGAGYSLFLDPTGATLVLQTATRPRPGQRQQFVHMGVVGAGAAASTTGIDPLPGKSNYFVGNDPRRWHSGIPQFGAVRYAHVYPGIDLIFYGRQGRLEYDFRVAPGADPTQAELQFDGADKLELNGGDLILSGFGSDGTSVKRPDGKDDSRLRLRAPHIYQRDGDRETPVDGGFVLRAAKRVAFEIGPYDRTRELIIDPVLDFSTYFGGNGMETSPSVAVNNDGFIYLAGSTTSTPTTFPLGGTVPITLGTAANVFIAKISPTQPPSVVYATFLGGSGGAGADTSVGLGVDSGGNTYLVGNTRSSDFPTTTLAYQTKPAAKSTQCASITCTSVFVSVLNSLGSALSYSTYLSGNGNDVASGMTIDTKADVFVTGTTTSNNTPTLNVAFPATELPVPYQSSPTAGSTTQFFVTKVNTGVPSVGGIAYSTYFGGGSPTGAVATGGGIAVDSNGNIYFSGTTNFYNSANGGNGLYGNSGSGDFPILNAYQPCLDTPPPTTLPTSNPCTAPAAPYPTDAFVAKLNPLAQAGSQLLFSTYLGGGGTDSGTALTIDSGAANIYLTGATNSTNFVLPDAIAPFQTCLNNPGVTTCPATPSTNTDAYVARLTNPALSTTGTPNFVGLTYFSYLGGGGNDVGLAIAVDTASDALVTGSTNSGTNATAGVNNPPNFPVTTDALQSALNGTQNAFFAHIDTSTTTGQTGLGSYATYFGGNGVDRGTSIAVDPNLNTYFAGDSTSTNLQVADALQSSLATGATRNDFVVKLGTASLLCIASCPAPTISPLGTVSAGNQVTITYTLFNEGPDVATNVNVNGLVPNGVVFNSATAGSGTCSTPTGTAVVCQIPTLQAGSTSIITFVVTPSAAGSYQATATVSSSNNTNTDNTATAAFVASGFSVIISPSAQTVAAGSGAQYTVTVIPAQGVFAANVSLSCSALPTGSTCNFANSTLTLNGSSSASTVLTLLTTAQPVNTAHAGRHGPMYAFWLMVPGMAVVGLGARKRRRKYLLGWLTLAILFGLLLLLPACHSGVTQPTVSGTPSGTYQLTVTATSGSLAKSAPFGLTVTP